uniref:Leucine-rich repeat-containing protein 71 n=1 Tax=Heliothis virescens TaxID=7102 RepID=A0A2A4K285_HELVI
MRSVSLRSLKSETRSEITSKLSSDDGLENADFDEFIQQTCKRFQCPTAIIVGREMLREPPPKSSKLKQESRSKRKMPAAIEKEPSFQTVSNLNPFEEKTLLVMAIYDSFNHLVEVVLSKYNDDVIPRVLMQLIALKVPYTRHLVRFTIRQCRIDIYTIYELNKILSLSNITDICLDNSFVKEGIYDMLLSERSSLRSLSLSRCYINDLVCERIAARLRKPEPAESSLLTLNLSSNQITDQGIKYLAEALRTNRHLRYLNVSDNHIGDVGAQYLFDVLQEFPLTWEETFDKRKCYLKYLRKKSELYQQYLSKFEDENAKRLAAKRSVTGKPKSSPKKDKVSIRRDSRQSTSSIMSTKALSMVLEILGPFDHHFNSDNALVRDGNLHCIGNFTLCYLNLRYNNLTFKSVTSLLTVVKHQKMYRTENQCGLVTVLIEGNYVPEECLEYKFINKEMMRSVTRKKVPGDKTVPSSR